MKAIILREYGSPDRFQEIDLPIMRPKSDEVLVQIKAGSINPIDYKIRAGRIEVALPVVLGHDCAGVIASVGHDVRRFREGDEVWVYLGGPCSNGAYAEYTTVPHQFVSLKPRNLTLLEAAVIPVVGLTAYQAIQNKAKPTIDDSIFLAGGSGGLGSFAIQLLHTLGISQIVTTAGPEQSVTYLIERLHLSPDQIIRYQGRSRRDLAAEAIDKNGGRLFTKVLDFVGGDMKRLCFDLVAFDGEIVSVVEENDPFAVPVWHGRLSPPLQQISLVVFLSTGCAGSLWGARSLGGVLPRSRTLAEDVRTAPIAALENGKSWDAIKRNHRTRPRTS